VKKITNYLGFADFHENRLPVNFTCKFELNYILNVNFLDRIYVCKWNYIGGFKNENI